MTICTHGSLASGGLFGHVKFLLGGGAIFGQVKSVVKKMPLVKEV